MQAAISFGRLAGVLVVASLCAGCVAFVAGAAGGGTGAVYVLGDLEKDIARPVPVVQRASVSALQELGLPIQSQTGDQLSARIESEFADGKSVRIDIESEQQNRSKLSIRVGVFGNERRSRRILEAIERHL